AVPEALLRVGDRQHGDFLALIRMLIEPERERILAHALDDPRGLARRQTLLGLTGKLRLAHLHRQHETHAIPYVLGRQFQPARHEVAKLAKLPHRIRGSRAQTVDMRAALHGRDQIDVALGDALLRFQHPGKSPVDGTALDVPLAVEGLGWQPLALAELFGQIFVQTARVEPLVAFAGELVGERDAQVGAQNRLGAQHLLEARDGELVRVEIFRIRPEPQSGAGFRLRHLAHDLELGGGSAAREAQVVFLAAAAHPTLQMLRQRVDHRNTDTVQSAGMLVGLVVEFSARTQPRQNQFHAAELLLGVNVHRHAAAVVLDLQGSVLEHGYGDVFTVARNRLIDAVVDYFVRQMIRARGVRIHARTAAYRVQATQHL